MAKENPQLISAIRSTAKRIAKSKNYQWGHMGSCNCGFLAQEITKLNRHEIHSRSMQKYGDWNDQLNDYCPTSGLLMDDLITQMLKFGLDPDDLKHLERLSDKQVLKRIPFEERHLRYNNREDVVNYLLIWADFLEERLLAKIQLPKLTEEVTIY